MPVVCCSAVADDLDPTKTQTFTYSSQEKLTWSDGLWGSYDYAYDGVGNRVSFTETVGGTPNIDLYTYPATSNQLQDIVLASGGIRTLTYDAAGNVTYDNRNGQGYGYNYDAAGRMSSFAINGVIQAEYEYNYQGHQVIRRLTQLGQTIHNIFDADGQRIAEYLYDDTTGTSRLIREYIWANGALAGVYENDTLYFVRTDHIGRPVFATDDTGLKVWEASYLPFGGVAASSGPNSDLRFPGQWFQSESGLHQNWMRDYDPTLGRYIQADPLGLVDGASVYGYVKQNPGRYVDPTGEYLNLPGGNQWGLGSSPGGQQAMSDFGGGLGSFFRGLARCGRYCFGNNPAYEEFRKFLEDNPNYHQCIRDLAKDYALNNKMRLAGRTVGGQSVGALSLLATRGRGAATKGAASSSLGSGFQFYAGLGDLGYYINKSNNLNAHTAYMMFLGGSSEYSQSDLPCSCQDEGLM